VVFIKLDKQADDIPLKALNIHPSLEGVVFGRGG
jgi:hypothetical protein